MCWRRPGEAGPHRGLHLHQQGLRWYGVSAQAKRSVEIDVKQTVDHDGRQATYLPLRRPRSALTMGSPTDVAMRSTEHVHPSSASRANLRLAAFHILVELHWPLRA